LTYNYENKSSGYQRNTNRLRSVDDAVATTGQTDDIEDQQEDNYTYDAVGNLIYDRSEEIESIQWTVSGKVLKVIRSTTSTKPNLEFTYDASGNRIAKKVIQPNGDYKTTFYVRDASGNVMAVYKTSGTTNLELTEQHIYGSSRLGIFKKDKTIKNKARALGERQYELTDHLGNVRVVLSDYKKAESIILSATDYYPFGMVARTYTSPEEYRYGFNGQEKDDETFKGAYDFGARILDVRLGRWLAVDPLYMKYPWSSSYTFVLNTPIQAFDPDGRKVYFVILTSNDPEHEGAALTRVREIQSSATFCSDVDQVFYIDLTKDNRLLKDIVASNLTAEVKKKYGTTTELSTYGHGGADGPVMGTQHTGEDDLSKYGNPLDKGQLTPDGWSKIDFNFDPVNSIAAFYGCKTEEFAMSFVLFTNVKYAAGLGMSAGVSEDNEEFDPNWITWTDEDLWLWDGNPINVYQKVSRTTQGAIPTTYKTANGDNPEGNPYVETTGYVAEAAVIDGPSVTVQDGVPIKQQ
jgi:RHS repeat-associated protein